MWNRHIAVRVTDSRADVDAGITNENGRREPAVASPVAGVYFAYWLLVTRMSVLSLVLAMCAPLPVLPPTSPVMVT